MLILVLPCLSGNTKKLIQKGAIENVIAIMQKYMENEDVQRSAAMAVASLARLEDNRAKLGEAGVHALRFHLSLCIITVLLLF